jgi:hypothetical protein
MSETQVESGSIDLGGLAKTPDLYPQNFIPQRQDVFMVRLSETQYREANFLDNRVVTRDMPRGLVRESEVLKALEDGVDARPLHFIFHCGHVGSTLLSRLLDETEQVLPLREPLPLRVLADGYSALCRRDALVSEERLNAYLEMFLKLWSRGYPNTRTVIVKATSSTARIAARLLAAQPKIRAVYMSLQAEPYLATLMAGANSILDLKGFAPERMRRIEEYLKVSFPPPHLISGGELAAMSWLTERLTEKKLLAEFGSRVMPLDFDDMLNDVKGALERVTKHFQMEVDSKYFDTVAQSPVLKRYSKAPEHEYSPEMRAELLAKARVEKETDIKKGLAWLEKLAAKHPDVAELLQQKPA